jgi:hypothetical protein
MGDDHDIEFRDPSPEQVGAYNEPPGIESPPRTSCIDENRGPASGDECAVSLAHTDEIEAERLVIPVHTEAGGDRDDKEDAQGK